MHVLLLHVHSLFHIDKIILCFVYIHTIEYNKETNIIESKREIQYT